MSLGGEQPPVVRLPAVVSLELDPVGDVRLDLVEWDRRRVPADHGQDLGPVAEDSHGLGQSRPRPAPGDDLLTDEADGVACDEPALRVVAGGRSDGAVR